MTRRVAHLLVEIALSFLVVYTLIFFAMAVLPLDPARAVLGPQASVEAVAELRHQFGLDAPLVARYFHVLSAMLHGEFGRSFYFNRPAGDIVSSLAPITFARAFAGLLFGAIFGILVGRMAARGSARSPVRMALIFAQSIPSFCFVLFLLWICSRGLGLTPIRAPGLFELLVIIAAGAYPFGVAALYVADRLTSMGIQPLHVDFLRMLHAPEQTITWMRWLECLPGAGAIAINSLGVSLTAVLFGELIFELRGFGPVFLRSCSRGDLSIVIAGTLLLSVIVLLLQRLGDVAIALIDPRLSIE